MEFNNIINPETGKKVSIYGKTGKQVLYNYVTYLEKLGGKGKSIKKECTDLCINGKTPSVRKKYCNRKSLPFPANAIGCQGLTINGWKSTKNKKGIYQWRKQSKKKKKKSKKTKKKSKKNQK